MLRLHLSFNSSTVLLPQSCRNIIGLGSSAFARHYSRNHCCFLLLRVLRCFSSPRSPHALRDVMIAHDGFPHSDICGSIRICQSPQLFAAYHVLLRLLEPQASPMRPFLLSFYHNEILVTSYLLLLLIFRLFRLLELISISQYLLDLRFQYVNVLFLFCGE